MGSHLSVGQRVSSIKRAFALSYGTWKLVCFSTLEKTGRRFSAQKGVIALLFDHDVDFDKIIQPFGLEYEGLVQRFFYFGWTVWLFALSYLLLKKLREHNQSSSTRAPQEAFQNGS
jgi:hypothetical protein